ncbi:uncharacterized protein LOC117303287 [Asterias rubens]|uniref:uncharacterized protein LOC117303287 n=1 Tax=Asterias rubens TaxID=7604 RepID=UPI0014552F91|nr:uncharacterized protein LOC117303287 [Asterias rubens]
MLLLWFTVIVCSCLYIKQTNCSYFTNGETDLFVRKHPQELFCEADFVLAGKVLRITKSCLSLQERHVFISASQSPAALIPTNVTVLVVKVKLVYKGRRLVKQGNTVVLVTSENTSRLVIALRKSYVFTGFVHLKNVPTGVGPCASLLHFGKHVFVENQLNFMLGCSWYQLRRRLSEQQRHGLTGAYANSNRCQIVRCYGSQEEPQRCFGDLKRALLGQGCVMYRNTELILVQQMTCSPSCDDGTCKWMTCASKKKSCDKKRRHISRVLRDPFRD